MKVVSCNPARRLHRLAVEHGGEPSSGFFDRDAFASGIVLELVLADAANAEVSALGVGEVEAADRSRGHHGERFCQRDADAVSCLEQFEDGAPFGVIGARG